MVFQLIAAVVLESVQLVPRHDSCLHIYRVYIGPEDFVLFRAPIHDLLANMHRSRRESEFGLQFENTYRTSTIGVDHRTIGLRKSRPRETVLKI